MEAERPLDKPFDNELKTIVYRGGVVRFRIPFSWREEYSDVDGGVFYEDNPDSGTLRVKVITLKTPKNTGGKSVTEMFEPLMQHFVRNEAGGAINLAQIGSNALMRYEQSTIEQGTKLKIFYWVFANPVSPEHARIVTFSYTVLSRATNKPRTIRDLQLLNEEVLRTEFAS